MHNILARTHLATLADFAHSSVLLGFGYDGTLAPLTSSPSRARMRAVTHGLLARVAQCYPCVVISGRTQDDLASRLDRLPLWHAFANYGHEPWAQSNDPAMQVHEWVRQLNERLGTRPGLVVEDKKYSVTIHYRHVFGKVYVREAIAEAIRELPNARAVGGDQSVNVLLRDGSPRCNELDTRCSATQPSTSETMRRMTTPSRRTLPITCSRFGSDPRRSRERVSASRPRPISTDFSRNC
jgi:trehalose 6-phosphate phosphatase